MQCDEPRNIKILESVSILILKNYIDPIGLKYAQYSDHYFQAEDNFC